VRLGTPALATRGFGDEEFAETADIVARAFDPASDVRELRERVRVLTDRFPLYASVPSFLR
jgi:glycine hydroxymethyltransferase